MKTGGNGQGKKKVVGDEEKPEGKPVEVVDVNILKGSGKTDSPGDKEKGDVGRDTKKSGEGAGDSSNNVTHAITAENTAKPVTDDAKLSPLAATTTNRPISETPATTADEKDDAAKEKVNPVKEEKEKAGPTLDGKPAEPKEGIESGKQKVEPVITDEGDFATPKRITKELPASPSKSLKEKLAPTLALTVPKNGAAPLSTTTVTDSTLSPLQKALDDAEAETLMERMARLKIGDASRQPPTDVAPPAHTDLESSDFECETAPSTPRSRAGRGSFSLTLHSEVPLSDDDDFFIDCTSNASVSNFGGL